MSPKHKKIIWIAVGLLAIRYIYMSTKSVSVMDENNNVNTKK